jgi:hypothetical protein
MEKRVVRIGMVILLVALLAGLFATAGVAQGSTKQVGLVVRFSNGSEHLQIVTVPTDASAFQALLASSLSVASSDSGFGPAICGLNNDGCPADNCFCDPNHFWAFWTLNAAGTDWDASMVGVSAQTPADKSVIGFAWSGFDANWNPTVKPTPHTFADLQRLVATPTPTPTPVPQEVPEPATIILLGGGLASLAGYLGLRWRTR